MELERLMKEYEDGRKLGREEGKSIAMNDIALYAFELIKQEPSMEIKQALYKIIDKTISYREELFK